MGLRAGVTPAVPPARAIPTRPALPEPAKPAGAAGLSARHGARAHRGEPAQQPGAGAGVRGGVGQGALMAGALFAGTADRRQKVLALEPPMQTSSLATTVPTT